MAVRPGEENVATLFGDIHYFYGPPTANPPHHRFDKGSYVYLFENASHRRARIEIANQPGTDDQDAFDGFLDRTYVRYSYKQQCLVSITVEGVAGPPIDPSQWHLPTYDPRNENKYHYKLHSVDIYFWTQDDALQFVDGIRRVLPASQIEVADEPAPPPSHSHAHGHSYSQDVNPLVQKLEKAAISDPGVQQQQNSSSIPSFAPPPTTASSGRNESPQSFVPMAYNPAAPPERERYQHREKTPPPPEDDGHNPLAAALARDHGAPPFSPTYGQTTFAPPPATPSFPGPPPPQQTYPGPTSPGIPPQSGVLGSPGMPPPPFGHLQRSVTMPVTTQAGLASPGLTSPYGANFPGTPSFPPPPPSTTTTVTTTTTQHPYQPQHHTPPPPGVQSPPGGYAQFSYGSPTQAPQGSEYSIHQQLYRPTEQEHAVKYKPKVERDSKLGQNAERLERGVTGMFKKFEKKFGV